MTNEQKYKTAEERVKAFEYQHCERYSDCAQCQYNSLCGGIDGRTIGIRIMAHWLAIEADEEKPEPCPFCGHEVSKKTHMNTGRNWIECNNCHYTSAEKSTIEDAIAAHNRVSRAVRAAKKVEAK